MNVIRSLHKMAMELSLEGDVAKAQGAPEKAIKFYEKAYMLEREAAFMTSEMDEDIIPHFVFLRGAAALANEAGMLKESEHLIKLGMSKNPPAWVVPEFEEILALVNSKKATETGNTSSVNISGMLIQADANENAITIKDKENKSYSVLVSMEQIRNIIKSHWLDKVAIEASQTPNGVFVLKNIQAVA